MPTTTIPANNSALANCSESAYISLGTGLGFNMLGAQPYSFECWVYPYDTAATGTIFSQQGEYTLSLNGGRIETMRTNQYGPLIGSTVLPANTWCYVAVTFDGYNLSIYYNGNLEVNQTASDPGIAPQGGVAQLGANNGSNQLRCDLDSFRAWKICLTQADLNLFAYDPPNGPQGALYAAIDFASVPAVDDSGLGIPINYQGAAIQQITSPGLLLDGATQYTVPTDVTQIATGGSTSYTIEAWIYLRSNVGLQCVFSSQDSQGNLQAMLYLEGGLLRSQRGSIGTLASTTPIPPNQWVDVATTYDGTNLTLFINGVQDCTSVVGALPAAATNAVQMGANLTGSTPNFFLNGYLQFITFWNIALTANQIIGILYEDPTNYPGLACNFDYTNTLDIYNNPCVDLTNGATVTPAPVSAPPTIQILRTTVTSLAEARALRATRVNSRQLNVRPTEMSGSGLGKPLARNTGVLKSAIPLLSSQHKDFLFSEFETLCLAGLNPTLQETLRAQYKAKVEDVFSKLQTDPDSIARVRLSIRQEPSEFVLTFVMPDGTLFISRVSSLEFTACQVWWGGFLFTVFWGLLSIYIRVPKEQLLNAIWVAMSNEATALAFEEALLAGTIGFKTIISITSALYSTGLLKTVLWMIAKSIGWWGFAKLLATIVGLFVPVPTPSKAYAAIMCVVTVAQMTLQFVGSTTPPVPSYSDSCG